MGVKRQLQQNCLNESQFSNFICILRISQKQNLILMISKAKCEICMEPYNTIQHCPRACISCGNSVCEKCLADIRFQQGQFRCPFCKSQNKDLWPKNLPLLNLLEVSTGVLLCQPHKNKAISVCSSPECLMPVGICELGECFKIHKEKGTNNIPLTLFAESTNKQAENKFMLQAIVYYYDQLENEVVKTIRAMKKEAIDKNLSKNVEKSTFTPENQEVIDKIIKGNSESVTSKKLSQIKTQLIDLQEEQEEHIKIVIKNIINKEKEKLTDIIVKQITSLSVDDFSLLKAMDTPRDSEPRVLLKSREQEPPEFFLIRKMVRGNFVPSLLFDSTIHTKDIFKTRLAGQPNLVISIELADSNIFGVYLKRPFVRVFHEDMKMVDKDAFVYWHNEKKIFKAAVNSVAQYDTSLDFCLSVGNTNNWDGFWLKNNFSLLNEGQQSKNKFLIQSGQYLNMKIQVATLEIRKVTVYQLDMI